MKKLPLIVKKLCRDKNLKMSELAERIGITPESLSRSINGNPQLSTINDIANALEVDIRTLFSNEDDIYGIIIINGTSYIINSNKELFELIKMINKN